MNPIGAIHVEAEINDVHLAKNAMCKIFNEVQNPKFHFRFIPLAKMIVLSDKGGKKHMASWSEHVKDVKDPKTFSSDEMAASDDKMGEGDNTTL